MLRRSSSVVCTERHQYRPYPAVVVDPEAVPALLPGHRPLGGKDVVDWITSSTWSGRAITTAMSPTYPRYATVVVPDGDTAKRLTDAALVDVLRAHTRLQPWWLG